MTNPKDDMENDLRLSLKSGDMYDIQCALLQAVQFHQVAVTETIQSRLEDFASFDEEVLDRVLERALSAAGQFMRNNAPLEGQVGSAVWIGRFVEGELTALQLLVGFIGTRQRGIVSEIFRRETARRKKISDRSEIGLYEEPSASDVMRLSYQGPDALLEASEAGANLNKALRHLKPTGRLAIALLYDVDGVCGVTDPRLDKSARAKALKGLLVTFGFSLSDVGKIMRRFDDISADIEGVIRTIDDSDDRTPIRRDGVFTQKQIARLLDVSPPVVSRLIKASFLELSEKIAA